MYRKDQDANVPGKEWLGPARIIGFDEKTVNVIHGTVPVTTSLHKLRPCSAAEMLAYQVLSRNLHPVSSPIVLAPGQQLGVVDARVAAPATRVVAPATSPPPRGRRPRVSAPLTEVTSSSHDAPRVIPAVTEPVTPVQRSDPERLLVEYDDRSILEKHLDATGHTFNDPGRRLAATMRKRRLDDPSGTLKERRTLPTAMLAY